MAIDANHPSNIEIVNLRNVQDSEIAAKSATVKQDNKYFVFQSLNTKSTIHALLQPNEISLLFPGMMSVLHKELKDSCEEQNAGTVNQGPARASIM